jgi:hypothetical protein
VKLFLSPLLEELDAWSSHCDCEDYYPVGRDDMKSPRALSNNLKGTRMQTTEPAGTPKTFVTLYQDTCPIPEDSNLKAFILQRIIQTYFL